MGQGIERLRSSADENHRELVGKLAQLSERVERIERQSVAAAAPVSPHPVTQPTPVAPEKPVAKIVPQATPGTKAQVKVAPVSGE